MKNENTITTPAELIKQLQEMEPDTKLVTRIELVTVNKGKILWQFNWIGGGFNSDWATTKEELIAQVKADYDGSNSDLKIDESSIRPGTKRINREMDRIGRMMTC